MCLLGEFQSRQLDRARLASGVGFFSSQAYHVAVHFINLALYEDQCLYEGFQVGSGTAYVDPDIMKK